MSIFGADVCKGKSPDDLSEYAKKTYVDTQDSSRVLKAMTGDLKWETTR